MVRNIIADVLERLQAAASARSVFGEPVTEGGRTVIPVARVLYGFGGGFGSDPRRAAADGSPDERGGGGGWMIARPAGALEVTDSGTRFISCAGPLHVGSALALGLLVGLTIGAWRGGPRQRS